MEIFITIVDNNNSNNLECGNDSWWLASSERFWKFISSYSLKTSWKWLFFKYRVSHVSCNIKNQHISASKSSNQFLKKNLKRSWSAVFGQRLGRGRCPVEHRGTFVRSCVRASPPHLEAQILASRLKSWLWGSNPGLEAQFPASRLKSQPWGSNPSLEAQILT